DDVVDAEIEQAATALEQTDTEQAAIEQAEIEHDRAEVGDPETGQAESGDAEVRETAMDADDGEAGLDGEIAGIVADIADGEQASNEREGWSQSPATDDGPSDDEFRFSFENEGR
ncbi:MAG: hypothetical protein IZT58_14880, partial [Actinobacteria bacterium]|nr:hypothetical protein [Actinomycetota bacterium]